MHLTELARLVPELVPELPDVAAPAAPPDHEQRQRLFVAITRAISAGRSPVLLVAEDLQWCNAHTLRFLHYLVRTQREAPLLVAATAARRSTRATR